MLQGWLFILAVIAILHATLKWPGGFEVEYLWPATGLVGGVMYFPVLCFFHACFLWRPQSPIVKGSPGVYFEAVQRILKGEEVSLELRIRV